MLNLAGEALNEMLDPRFRSARHDEAPDAQPPRQLPRASRWPRDE